MTAPGRPRVLLVDDDPEIGEFLATLLDLEGLEPVVALGAAQALALAPGVQAAVIDVAMPDVDGLTLCRQLRAAGFDEPILVVSARPGAELARLAAEAGADEFLRKPFDNAELIARLHAWIAGGRRGSAAPAGP
jgi:two-component system response regulator MprA